MESEEEGCSISPNVDMDWEEAARGQAGIKIQKLGG